METIQNSEKRTFDLEERLIDFAICIIEISENMRTTAAGKHISGQVVRSGTAPALNYGEAQSAESRNDFIHKVKIILKELRETRISLKIIMRYPLTEKLAIVEKAIKECNELTAIFNKSVETAKRNNEKNKGLQGIDIQILNNEHRILNIELSGAIQDVNKAMNYRYF